MMIGSPRHGRAGQRLQHRQRSLRQRGTALRAEALRLAGAIEAMPQALLLLDARQRAIRANAPFFELFGLSSAFIDQGSSLLDLLRAAEEHGRLLPGTAPPSGGSRAKGGPELPAQLELADGRLLAMALRHTRPGGWVVTFTDVTAYRAAESRAEQMARQDVLTGLPNRLLLKERLAEELARARRMGEAVAVLCLDLDRFKTVNDTLGHPIGDALLRTVAERLRYALRETDLVARLGGDEFAILQTRAEQPTAAGMLAARLVDLIGRPYVLDGAMINIGTSIGLAIAPGDGTEPDRLLKSADLALYRAKGEGRGTFRYFAPEMDAKAQARRALELDLRRALALREFHLHYQPQLNLSRGRVAGFEALLRWNRPEHGAVPPSEFVPLAEEIGLIVPIGEWVLRTACLDAVTWPEEVSLAVNLSPAQFKSPQLVEMVQAALAGSGLAPGRLELEITESVLLHDSAANLGVLHRLRDLGIRIAMDDFGTGYSSLSYLRSFPFDKIKIDRSFVRDLTSSGDCAAIVRAIAGLGASLGMVTTAEGVETAEQLGRIRAEGCAEIQGYLISRPVPAAEIPALIAAAAATAGCSA